ncbi:uncharacterized protein DUF4294 [Flavobacterium croceum DSM 17960]|uniref:Uncharacterized protein DUF4294 n=1 Tax=Flavobacterium croceum DSM 17960 TaxID=1121886 RepID=A0A2S4N6E7_9FLAO|nr:DUF4294 domain-containing protein [Flavobacterium croceum]POS01289.1 uncharacterized protein DUF4294 [Flavobacterium croceum DSM 17960]
MRHIYIGILLVFSTFAFAQKEKDYVVIEEDTLQVLRDTIFLKDVYIAKQKMDPEAKKQFILLQNRVYRTYPYAKVASERLLSLNANMARLKTAREKKKYLKIVEDYLENEFKEKLKKMSNKQGQVLVKLIYRQTGISTYDLIKEYKSGWKAFWSNNTASLFNINLKATYQPYEENEDYLIETILHRAFFNGSLVEQKPAVEIDYDKLTEYWEAKLATTKP